MAVATSIRSLAVNRQVRLMRCLAAAGPVRWRPNSARLTRAVASGGGDQDAEGLGLTEPQGGGDTEDPGDDIRPFHGGLSRSWSPGGCS